MQLSQRASEEDAIIICVNNLIITACSNTLLSFHILFFSFPSPILVDMLNIFMGTKMLGMKGHTVFPKKSFKWNCSLGGESILCELLIFVGGSMTSPLNNSRL